MTRCNKGSRCGTFHSFEITCKLIYLPPGNVKRIVTSGDDNGWYNEGDAIGDNLEEEYYPGHMEEEYPGESGEEHDQGNGNGNDELDVSTNPAHLAEVFKWEVRIF
jgi:hypothetical protein